MTVDTVLKGHDLFRSLGVDDTREIAKFSSVKKCEAGTVVFELGDPGDHIYMLMDGSVDLRLAARHQNVSLVISKIEKGELFGLSPLLDSPRYTATAECGEDTELLSIEARQLRELLKRNALVGFNVMNQVAHIYFTRYTDVLKNLQAVVGQISLIR